MNKNKIIIEIDRDIIEQRLCKRLSDLQWTNIKDGLEGQYSIIDELSRLVERVDIGEYEHKLLERII